MLSVRLRHGHRLRDGHTLVIHQIDHHAPVGRRRAEHGDRRLALQHHMVAEHGGHAQRAVAGAVRRAARALPAVGDPLAPVRFPSL